MKQNIYFTIITLLNISFLFYYATDPQQLPTELPNIRAKSIELVDSKGISRASLIVEPDGETVFRLRDADGTIRVKLGASRDGSGLVMLNAKTETGFHVLAKASGTSVTITDTKGMKKELTP